MENTVFASMDFRVTQKIINDNTDQLYFVFTVGNEDYY